MAESGGSQVGAKGRQAWPWIQVAASRAVHAGWADMTTAMAAAAEGLAAEVP
jgi:hypothetical protein